ncbi:hypothetical protein WJX74_002706 [Apatococcus lobatus]|uniref:Uncharacterized protein n=1 Tax=Apatococcus lobatus TaxID=904363 RepID=A0AAW1RA76_9CHLO
MEDVAAKAKEKKQNNSLLMLACTRGYTEDVKKLLEMGAEVTARDKKGYTPLHFAAGQGRLDIVKFLWSKAAETEAEDPAGRMPLHMAAIGGHPETIAFLLDKGVWADAYDSLDDTALHIAARRGDIECVKVLLQHKAQAISRNKRSLSPLGEAIVSGHPEVAACLVLEGGCNPKEKQKGWSLLHLAAALGLLECLTLLLNYGCDIQDADNSDGYTPLHCAAIGGHGGCMDALLAAKADTAAVSAKDSLAVDLLSKDASKDMRQKLTPTGPRKPRPLPAGSSSEATSTESQSSQNPADAFRGLNRDAQRAQMLRWKEMNPADRPKALVGLPAEVESRLKEADTVQQMVTIQKAIVRLHEDEDFQQDANDPSIEPALDIMRADPRAMDRYEGNARMMRVLHKLRSFQGVITANGRHKVPFPELVVADKPDWRQHDARRAQGMAGMLAAQISAACAAACAGSEEEAKAAAAKAAEPPAPTQTPAGSAAPAAAGASSEHQPKAAAKPSAVVSNLDSAPRSQQLGNPGTDREPQLSKQAASGASRQAAAGSASAGRSSKASKRQSKVVQGKSANSAAGGSGQQSGSGNAAGGAGGGEDDLDRMPSWKEVFSWQKFKKELKRQLYQSVILIACLLVFMWWQGLPLPWQEGHPGLAAILGLGRNSTVAAPTPAASSPVLEAGRSSSDPGFQHQRACVVPCIRIREGSHDGAEASLSIPPSGCVQAEGTQTPTKASQMLELPPDNNGLSWMVSKQPAKLSLIPGSFILIQPG